jgi:hypothetical protein
MGAKKRQTLGKMIRERERAEKRARKLEKKEQRKAEALAGRQAESPIPAQANDDGQSDETPITRGLDSA